MKLFLLQLLLLFYGMVFGQHGNKGPLLLPDTYSTGVDRSGSKRSVNPMSGIDTVWAFASGKNDFKVNVHVNMRYNFSWLGYRSGSHELQGLKYHLSQNPEFALGYQFYIPPLRPVAIRLEAFYTTARYHGKAADMGYPSFYNDIVIDRMLAGANLLPLYETRLDDGHLIYAGIGLRAQWDLYASVTWSLEDGDDRMYDSETFTGDRRLAFSMPVRLGIRNGDACLELDYLRNLARLIPGVAHRVNTVSLAISILVPRQHD